MATNGLALLGGDNGLAGGDGGGVYTRNPAAQLKYVTGSNSATRVEPTDTQARLFVTIPGKTGDEVATLGTGKPWSTHIEAAAKYGYLDFFLQTASEAYQEKVQINELLADNYSAYFFGERAPVFQYAGMLLSTQQDDWWVGFTHLYREILRGTKLATLGALCHLRYDSRLITGALLDFSTSLGSDLQMAVQFRFSVLVKDVRIMPSVKMGDLVPKASFIGSVLNLEDLNPKLELVPDRSSGTTVYKMNDHFNGATDVPNKINESSKPTLTPPKVSAVPKSLVTIEEEARVQASVTGGNLGTD